MCCSCPDRATAARRGNDSWLMYILPEPKMPQIASTTFEAEGVQLPPQQLKELKAIATERDEQRKWATGDENGMAYWTVPSIFFGPRPSWLG